MPELNEQIEDAFITYATLFAGLEKRKSDKFAARYEEVVKEVGARMSGWKDIRTKREALKRIAELQKRVSKEIDRIAKDVDVEWAAVAATSHKFVVNEINKAAKVKLVIGQTALPKPHIDRVVRNISIRGYTPKFVWKHIKEDAGKKIHRAIITGYAENATSPQIARVLINQAGTKLSPALIKSAVRTGMQAVNAQVREDVYQDNKNVLKGVKHSSVLDSRTSDICMSYSGAFFELNSDGSYKPSKPGNLPYRTIPLHFNCRSSHIPVTKSFEELLPADKKRLGRELDRRRSSFSQSDLQTSMTGKVPAELNYTGWLKRQPAALQKKILGPTTYKAWKESGRVELRDILLSKSKTVRSVKDIEKAFDL